MVNDIPLNRVGAKLVDIYRTDITPKEAFEARELLKYSKDYYRKKGTGRPTKKDRRDIYDFYEEMDSIFTYCENPIFVAHNGNSFDHKILLQKQILKPNKCRLLDSRIILRLFLEKEIAQKSLSAIFEYLYGYVPVAHRAQNDVQMMLLIFKKLKIKEELIKQIFH